jgi:hypothetical protein
MDGEGEQAALRTVIPESNIDEHPFVLENARGSEATLVAMQIMGRL